MMAHVRRYWPFVLTLAVFGLDRWTKVIVTETMRLHQSNPFLGNLVRFTYVHNDGGVFGYHFFPSGTLAVVNLIAVVVVTVIILRMGDDSPAFRWILAAILGGAIGNTFDRIAYGYVIDFIDVDMPNWLMERFAVFNVADSAVTVGVVLLLILLFFQRTPEPLPAVPADSTQFPETPTSVTDQPVEDNQADDTAEPYVDHDQKHPANPDGEESPA